MAADHGVPVGVAFGGAVGITVGTDGGGGVRGIVGVGGGGVPAVGVTLGVALGDGDGVDVLVAEGVAVGGRGVAVGVGRDSGSPGGATRTASCWPTNSVPSETTSVTS